MGQKSILIIQGHPDGAGGHLCHGLADAYAAGAESAGHRVMRVDVGRLDFPLLRSQAAFEMDALPEGLNGVRDALIAADHVVLLFPLWLGTLPAVLKAFLEQLMRPGIAFLPGEHSFPRALLTGRSARLVVTMGTPAFIYRCFFFAPGVRSVDEGILGFSGMSPVRHTYFGRVDAASLAERQHWLLKMRQLGERGA
ncbi:NAD(P)H-dependent oxidoreductase [Azorhizobium doebereinerae]|uniref:NAD(P)H-dependent oxidoreductase n=1 Tax=Azorhizobium doebereinerae TaxID=281091 RepID=UPI0004140C21|nr:NAD(P)H-dependent oxidoreductase [Azorhizobium doebereinerae]